MLDYLPLVLGSGTIIALDTWTKGVVDRHIPAGASWLPDNLLHLLPYVRIVHVHNKGTAFSMFANTSQINLIVSLLAAIVAMLILVLFHRINRQDKILRLAVILQLGGTVGNLISRLRYGYVVDFISVGDFAVFNLADASLVAGAALMLIFVGAEEWRSIRRTDQSPSSENAHDSS